MSIFTDNVSNRIAAIEKRKQEILSSRMFSELGRTQALETWRQELPTSRARVVSDLASEWAQVRAEYKAVGERRTKAGDAEANRWNFERLNFELNKVKQQLDKPVYYLKEQYQAAVNSGDLHRQRAWGEAADTIREKFTEDTTALEFSGELKKNLVKLTTTPETLAAKEAGSVLAQRAIEAYKVTNQARAFFDNEMMHSREWAFSRDFEALTDGVSISEKMDTETFSVIRSVEIA